MQYKGRENRYVQLLKIGLTIFKIIKSIGFILVHCHHAGITKGKNYFNHSIAGNVAGSLK